MIKKEILDDLVLFLNKHVETQLRCMNLSKELNKNGFPGFAWFYQIQANDEFLHQRRIINYLQSTLGAEDYTIQNVSFKSFKIKNAEEGLNYYIDMRKETMDLVIKLKSNALKSNDFLTASFYDWFMKDYWTEIDENNDVLDRVKMDGAIIAGIDRRLSERAEIDPENVIHPMKAFVAD